jgi:hypothetical protein
VLAAISPNDVELARRTKKPAAFHHLSAYLWTQIAHRSGLRATPVCTCEINSREAATMRRLIFGMNVTLDGYSAATGGDIGWSGTPSEELFQWRLEQERASGLSRYERA